MNLQEIRVARKIEQAYLAKEIGTNAPMLSNFEHYKCLPIPAMLEKICEILNCKVSDIYADNEIYMPNKAESKEKSEKENKEYGFYQLSVSLPNSKRTILTKANFKKCGYKSMKDYIVRCIDDFERKLKQVNEKTAKHSNCSAANTSDNTIDCMHQ